MKFADMKVKLAMILVAGGLPAAHGVYGRAFGEAAAGLAPVAEHVLAALGL